MTGIRKAIITCARGLVGVPFHHQGRCRLGIDCVGVVIFIGKGLGLMPKDEDYLGYAMHPDGDTLCRELGKYMTEIDVDDILPGDVAVFYGHPKSKLPQHVAIVTEDGDGIIHAHSGSDRVVETPMGKWEKRLVCGFRYSSVSALWQP